MREPAFLLKVVVSPPFEFAQGMLVEKGSIGTAGRDFPCGRLGAILAKFEGMGFRRLPPCAADAHVAFRLVLMSQERRTTGGNVFLQQYRRDRLCGAPASRRPFVGRNFWVCFWSAAQDLAPLKSEL